MTFIETFRRLNVKKMRTLINAMEKVTKEETDAELKEELESSLNIMIEIYQSAK